MKKTLITDFTTDNFQLASYLLSAGYPIQKLDKNNPRRAQFFFEDSTSLREEVRRFISYEAVVEPHRYFSAQKDIKQLLYAD